MKLAYFVLIFALFAAQALGADRLKLGECLTAGQQLTSPSGCFIFIFQSDGNGVIYRIGTGNSMTAVFNTQTNGKGAERICLQTDGNLVVYRGSTAFFNTQTSGKAANFLIIQDDGNLVLYNADATQHFWASNTVQSGVTCPAMATTAKLTTTTTATTTTTLKVPTSRTNRLNKGECLTSGLELTSTNGCFIFAFNYDGSGVIAQIGAKNVMSVIFRTGTAGTGADRICMQNDGNLVIYGGSKAVFSTGAFEGLADHVKMQNDGNLVVYNANESLYFWASNTPQGCVTCPAASTTVRASTIVM